jgi:sn-glycerol 3-phosphate transport system substrate-binding protein
MRRLVALLATFLILTTACGGSDDAAEPAAGGDDDTATDSDAAGDDEPAEDDTDTATDSDDTDDGATGGGSLDEGGGSTEDELADELDLQPCPVGAHVGADGPIEIDFWHAYTALTEEAMQDVAAAFNASQDQIVVNVEAQGSYTELLATYRESISFGSLPDIAVFDAQTLRDVVDSGTIVPAQSCVEADTVGLDHIDETVRAFFSLDGALYPSAMNVSVPVLYYNRGHFEAAGLDPDDPPGTLAEIRDAAQAIKDAGIAETPLSLLMQGWFIDTWLTGAGVPLVDADNGRAGNASVATFNGPEALEIYTLLDEMNKAGLIVATSNTPGQLGHYLAVASEAASMVIETSTASTTVAGVLGGTANLSALTDGADGITELSLDLDVAPMPGLREPGKVFISGGAYFIANTGSDAEQAAAWEFMKFLNNTESQKTIHLKGSYLPIIEEVLNDPDVQSVWANDAAGQWLATAHAQLTAIDPEFAGPVIGPFTEQRQIIQDSLEAMLLGGEDPAAVLAEAEQLVTEALEQYADQNF